MNFSYLCENRHNMEIKFEGSALDYARSLTKAELKKVIKACKQGEYNEWLDRCRICFEKHASGNEEQAEWWSNHAELVRPE